MTDEVGQFEMRRLEALSNAVFGVAMTLLAYDLPDATSFTGAPDWVQLYHTYARPLIALVLSFVIAGMFWLSHHRRLAYAPTGGRVVVMLNLMFLLTIVVLPVTNGLYSAWRDSSVVTTLYGLHLTLIAAINALLWWIALPSKGAGVLMAAAAFPAAVFIPATLVAAFRPTLAPWILFLAFGAPLIDWLARRNRL